MNTEESMNVLVDEAIRLGDKLTDNNSDLSSDIYIDKDNSNLVIRVITKRFSRSIFTRIIDTSDFSNCNLLYDINGMIGELSDNNDINQVPAIIGELL